VADGYLLIFYCSFCSFKPIIIRKQFIVKSYVKALGEAIQLSCIYLFIPPFLTPFFLSHTKLRSAHTSTVQIALVLQNNCEEWGSCSRSLHSNCLRRLLNPYSPHYRLTSLTNRPPCLRTIMGEQLVQGCYAWGRFEPANHRLQRTTQCEHCWCVKRVINGWLIHFTLTYLYTKYWNLETAKRNCLLLLLFWQ